MSETNAATVERLKKLLAVANHASTGEHEAEAAMNLAQRLMTEHNLTLAQIENSAGTAKNAKREKTHINGKALYEYQRTLMGAVADANFCLHWMDYDFKKQANGVFRKVPKHLLVGREANVIAATQMFDYLNTTMERLVPLTSNTSRLSKSAISWKEGCAARLIQRLRTKKAQLVAENKAKEDAARPTQDHNGGGSALAIRLENLFEMESDANYEFAFGMAPGSMAKRREEDKLRRDNYVAPEAKPETPAEKAKREAKQKRQSETWQRQYDRKMASKDWGAFHAGDSAGREIGLDEQIAAEVAAEAARLK